MSDAAHLGQGEVELLLDDLRRLVDEARRLKGERAGADEANRDEIEWLRWKIASAVRSATPTTRSAPPSRPAASQTPPALPTSRSAIPC
jgi:hypothetical protein